jgi:hypothetical protein
MSYGLQTSRSAAILIESGEAELADDPLTYFSTSEMSRALDLVDTIARSLEARTRLLHGFSTDPTTRDHSALVT